MGVFVVVMLEKWLFKKIIIIINKRNTSRKSKDPKNRHIDPLMETVLLYGPVLSNLHMLFTIEFSKCNFYSCVDLQKKM